MENIQNLLVSSINRKNKLSQTLSAVIYKTLIDFFHETKQIDITPFLTSIQLKQQICIIKTSNTTLSSEILLYQDSIVPIIEKKLQKIGIPFPHIELRVK